MSDLMKQFGIWNVRIVRQSESYGRNDCLCHDEDKELVEFYDTRYRNDKEWKRGQFVSRYYLETLLEDAYRLYRIGLSLDGGIPEWTVPVEDMINIIAWLQKFDTQRKENCTMKTVSTQLVKVISVHARVRYDYSGRGMMGEQCFGFVAADPEVAIGAIQKELDGAEELRKEFSEVLQHSRCDSIGLDTILYFPGYQTAETGK